MSNVWLWPGLGAAGLVLFFSLAHHALRRFSRARLEETLQSRSRLGRLQGLFEHHETLARTTALLWAAGLVLMAVLLEIWSIDRFGAGWRGYLIGAVVAAGLAMTVGGIIPMTWARCRAESVLTWTLPVLQFCRAAFAPLDRVLMLFDILTRRLLGAAADAKAQSFIEEEIRSVVSEGEREGAIEEDQVDMIESVIEFKKEDVAEIMTPRTDIISIEEAAGVEDARRLIIQSGHSRIPVTEGNLDQISGILYAKDLLQDGNGDADRPRPVREVMRRPLFIPETKKLDELQAEFQAHKVHMAIVVDEYGGTAGLVTIEDIIEEVFGEIVDEYEEEPEQPIRRLDHRVYQVDARVHVDELNDELGLELPDEEDFETIGGFVLARLGTIPEAGEVLDAGGIRITVLEADERRITRLRIDLPEALPGTAATESAEAS